MEAATGPIPHEKTSLAIRLEYAEERIKWIMIRLKWIEDFERRAILRGLERDQVDRAA
jgi:hypothetical protein